MRPWNAAPAFRDEGVGLGILGADGHEDEQRIDRAIFQAELVRRLAVARSRITVFVIAAGHVGDKRLQQGNTHLAAKGVLAALARGDRAAGHTAVVALIRGGAVGAIVEALVAVVSLEPFGTAKPRTRNGF